MGRRAYYFDWLIFIPALLLMFFGLMTLLSIDPHVFYQQLFFAFVGIGLFVAFSRIDFDIYKYLDRFIYIGGILFLLLTYLGPDVRGATRWLEIGSFRLQPSEIVKPFMLLAWSSLLTRYPPTKLKYIGLHTGLLLLPFLLIFKQPDLGSAIIYVSSWMVMTFLAGISIFVVIASGIILGMVAPVIYELLHDYQKKRLQIFLNPLIDPQGAGYNAIQSMIAVGSGLFLGRGFGKGTQSLLQFLPERHTDFIFASLTEEFGLLGGGVLLLIFFLLLWRILKQTRSRMMSPMVCLYAVGIFTQLFMHVVINVGMNMGLLPITGITLPFVSYGGSSLLSNWIGLGILVAALQKTGN